MFISKKELAKIQKAIRNLDETIYGDKWYGLNAQVKNLAMAMDLLLKHLGLEITDEPAKKYLRKKVEEEKK